MLDFKRMNQAQAEAVRHTFGPALITAGPGSGKTFVITSRLLYLIESCHIEPSSLLVITFTKAAALSMQQRFLTSVHGRHLPVFFGTFHSFFFQILQKYSIYHKQSILTPKEKAGCLSPILQKHRIELCQTGCAGEEISIENISDILSLISLYKNNPSAAKDGYLKSMPLSLFMEIFKEYQAKIDSYKKLDFDDMLIKCLSLFQTRPDVLNECRRQFHYIMIDEFQDCNPVQYQIIRLLAATNNNILVVGDDDQSIYGFRGASPCIMQQFMTDYPDAVQILLNINYRSAQLLVETTSKIILENKCRIPKLISSAISSRSEMEDMICMGFADKEQQYKYLAEKIQILHKLIPYEEMAVIFRTNKEIEYLAENLDKWKVPFSMKEIRKNKYEHFVSRDIVESIQFALGRRTTPPNIIYALGRSGQEIKKMSDFSPYTAIHFFRKVLGYDTYLKNRAKGEESKLQEWVALAEQMQKEARTCLSFGVWFENLEMYRERMEAANKEAGESKKGIRLMTIHASKGLEYTYVCLPDVNEGVIPHGQLLTADELEEERRMLYVGMTRAKTALDILYVTGTQEHPKLPSRFLNPILKK